MAVKTANPIEGPPIKLRLQSPFKLRDFLADPCPGA